MTARLLILTGTLLCGAGAIARASHSEPIPVRKSFRVFPMQMDAWRGRQAQPLDAKVLKILGVDEYLNLIYGHPTQPPVGLYVGYYQSQREGDTIHSPLNCLPGAGWEPVAKDTLPVTVQTAAGPREIVINRYRIRKGADEQVVLYWYQSHGRVVASEYASKVYMVLDAMRTNRTDAALVRVIAPVVGGPDGGDEAAAERNAVEFVQTLFPRLSEYLPS